MSFVIDFENALPTRPSVPASRSPVEPAGRSSLNEHRLQDPDVFIPGRATFADYLMRENVLARYADAQDTFRPERSEKRRPQGQDDAGRGPGGWPRLGDVPDERRTIERVIEKTYKFERLLPVGTRIDVYH